MAMDLEKLRKLVSLDPGDPLSRFALGRKLAEIGQQREAAEHLRFANSAAPEHLATYRVLAEVLIALGQRDEARTVLVVGIEKVRGVGEGMGRDLGPVMQEMLEKL
jgi:predicted Zn-dependent protease